MKKMIAAILAAFLMSAGLVATASSPAAAAPDCTYPATCFETGTNAFGLRAKKAKQAKLFVGVTSFGNGQPTGRILVTFIRPNGQSFVFSRAYPSRNGKKKVYTFNGLRKGNYDVVVTFNADDDSQYYGSSETTSAEVKAKKRRR